MSIKWISRKVPKKGIKRGESPFNKIYFPLPFTRGEGYRVRG